MRDGHSRKYFFGKILIVALNPYYLILIGAYFWGIARIGLHRGNAFGWLCLTILYIYLVYIEISPGRRVVIERTRITDTDFVGVKKVFSISSGEILIDFKLLGRGYGFLRIQYSKNEKDVLKLLCSEADCLKLVAYLREIKETMKAEPPGESVRCLEP